MVNHDARRRPLRRRRRPGVKTLIMRVVKPDRSNKLVSIHHSTFSVRVLSHRGPAQSRPSAGPGAGHSDALALLGFTSQVASQSESWSRLTVTAGYSHHPAAVTVCSHGHGLARRVRARRGTVTVLVTPESMAMLVT